MLSRMMCCRACCKRGTRSCWILVVLLMFVLNVVFIIDFTINHSEDGVLHGLLHRVVRHEGPARFFSIKVLSSHQQAEIAVDGKTKYVKDNQRGIHVVVLSPTSGEVMAARMYDTYLPNGDSGMVEFLDSLLPGRIVCFAVLDEGQFSMQQETKDAIEAFGSQIIKSLAFRDTWSFVAVKGEGLKGEDVGRSVSEGDWGQPVNLHVTIPVLSEKNAFSCDWPKTLENQRRKKFCSLYEGYGSLCNCAEPLHFTSPYQQLPGNTVADIPVTIIASNRPQYLFRSLRQLLSIPGANASMVTVYIDGFFQEPVEVCELFGIHSIQHEPSSQKNGRIAQHYKASLSKTFELYPEAQFTIILEEDLEVAPDFFSYFSQTKWLLEEDQSLYCISAWNDQGYDHSCQDPGLMYRIESMPGLGWLLSRRLFKEELEPQWPSPDKLWDWDMWMRTDYIRKGRECVIPDVSRTFHFGATGLNMNPYFQSAYFMKHTINDVAGVVMKDVNKMTKDEYEEVVKESLRNAGVLDHSKNPCKTDIIPNTEGKIYVLYIRMKSTKDFDQWMVLAKCFHLWDLDARGFHKGLWRFWLKKNQIMVVGAPYSPYSKDFMPSNITPLVLAEPKKD